jgi:NADH:ubiquinone oxidoreductase subunit
VLYKGLPEPSKVPPNWHGWLHYTLDAPLPETPSHPWVKPPLPNLTGTKEAYLPQGHVARTGEHAATIADYQPWTPS